MAQQKLIAIQNLTAHTQKCFWNGMIYSINPYQVREFIEGIAYAFFDQRPKFVVEYKPIELPEPAPGEKLVWLANNTGNPFLPEVIKLKRYKKGEEEEFEIPNPIREPAAITRSLSLGQRIVPQKNDPTADESLNLGRRKIVIPPYTRVCVSEGLSNWLLRRDMMAERQHRGRLIECRPPTDCDPNVSWELERLRVLAKIMEIPDEMLGQHEAELRARFAGNEEAQELGILQAKQDLMYVLFFRIIDERFWQPSKTELDAFIKELENDSRGIEPPPVIPQVAEGAIVQSDDTKLTLKKRGRPPKKRPEAQAEA